MYVCSVSFSSLYFVVTLNISVPTLPGHCNFVNKLLLHHCVVLYCNLVSFMFFIVFIIILIMMYIYVYIYMYIYIDVVCNNLIIIIKC